MVSVLTSSVVIHGFEHRRVKPKTIKLVFVGQQSLTLTEGTNLSILETRNSEYT